MKNLLLATVAAVVLPLAANAHFLLQYTEHSQVARRGDVPMKLIFWHPFDNSRVMDMAPPEEFFMVHRGVRIDLSDRLVATTFVGACNEGAAFDATIPVKRSGDYVIVTVPAPYYDENEDAYIQQITKSFLNRNAMPTDWSAPVGLPTEIIPLSKPYNIIAGSNFAGRVVADGKPVAGAEIEIEYVAAEPDMETGTATEPTVSSMPGGAVVAIADDNGYFSFGVPRAGIWGLAALGSGPVTEYEGKKLSQDAVIWIRAHDLE